MRKVNLVLAMFAVLSLASLGITACGGSGEKSQQDIASESQAATVLIVGTAQGVSPTSGSRGQQFTCSGWVNTELGTDLVVTDAHCLGAPILTVNGTPATIVGVDNLNDVAVIKVPGISAATDEPLELADEAPEQGDTVYTLGYPSNASLENPPYQVTTGTVTALQTGSVQVNADDFSGLWESIELPNDNAIVTLNGLMQTTSPTTHGGSGGPVLNDQGEVIGMTETGTTEGEVNQATNWDTLKRLLPPLAAGDNNAFIGVGLSAVPTDYANYLGTDGLFFISYVQPGSTADATELGYLLRQAATKYGAYLNVDTINGQSFQTQQDMLNFLAGLQPGQEVRLHVYATTLDGSVDVDLGTASFTAP